jgi:hypothetical protein
MSLFTGGERRQMIFYGALWGIIAAVLIFTRIAQAHGQTLPSAGIRQSLDDAWWTGPMLAPSANTLPKGHFLLEPYVYDVMTDGFFNSSGKPVSTPQEHEFGSLTYINYGLFNKFTVGVIPTFDYVEPSNGPSSSRIGVGDLTVQAQYRLHLFRENTWIPTVSMALQETLPTGKYDQLANRPSNGVGAGAFTTSPSLYTQTFFWMPNGRILRMRFNVVPAFSRQVTVQGVSIYGTGQDFRGHAKPGASVFVDLAGEYSLTRHWVLALDATYRDQSNTPVAGYNMLNSNPIDLNSGASDAFGLAPAVEYNWRGNIGVLLGVRLIPAAHNTSATVTPALAINFVH